jgi:hypothetical protein
MTASLINPTTGRTTRHEAWLAHLMSWTSDKRIVRALLAAGIASPADLARCAVDVKATVDSRAPDGLSEEQVANRLLLFLQSRDLRRAIASYVSAAHMKPRADAIRELRALQDELWTAVKEGERWKGGLVS